MSVIISPPSTLSARTLKIHIDCIFSDLFCNSMIAQVIDCVVGVA